MKMDRPRIIMGICSSLQKSKSLFSLGANRNFTLSSKYPTGAQTFSKVGLSRVCWRWENNWNSNNRRRWKSSQSKLKSTSLDSNIISSTTTKSSSVAAVAAATAKHKKRKDSLDSLGTWDTATDLPLQVGESRISLYCCYA